MEEQLATELLQIVRAVKLLSPTTLSFAGTISDVSENDLVQPLGRLLYLHCYSRRFSGSINEQVTTAPEADQQFLEQLSAANSSREYLDRGWHILRTLPTGHFVAEKNGLTRVLFAGEFISHSDIRGPLKDGAPISIYCPRESKTMHPGFYYVFGETLGDQLDDTGLLRFYWNLTPEGAIHLVRLLTKQLNHFQLPFRLKVLNSPADYNRSDSAILYLNSRYFRVGSHIISEVHREVDRWLKVDTPLFTKKLERGLGLAEEPITGESFGQQRCRILATAISNLCASGSEGGELEEIGKQFELNGLSLDHPYRNPGSLETYEFAS